MFTGIVREVGTVALMERTDGGTRLEVSATFAPELAEGDSVAVSGACLTVTGLGERSLRADVMNQTLSVTSLGALQEGSRVNLEPAIRAGDPLGGHLVQGHVDCVARVTSARKDGFATRLAVQVPSAYERYLVERGSVAVDGVSLTVASLAPSGFEVSLIPETLERTTLGELGEGAVVNVELDVVARYVERLLQFESEDGDVE